MVQDNKHFLPPEKVNNNSNYISSHFSHILYTSNSHYLVKPGAAAGTALTIVTHHFSLNKTLLSALERAFQTQF
jgi:hypothetical protein